MSSGSFWGRSFVSLGGCLKRAPFAFHLPTRPFWVIFFGPPFEARPWNDPLVVRCCGWLPIGPSPASRPSLGVSLATVPRRSAAYRKRCLGLCCPAFVSRARHRLPPFVFYCSRRVRCADGDKHFSSLFGVGLLLPALFCARRRSVSCRVLLFGPGPGIVYGASLGRSGSAQPQKPALPPPFPHAHTPHYPNKPRPRPFELIAFGRTALFATSLMVSDLFFVH